MRRGVEIKTDNEQMQLPSILLENINALKNDERTEGKYNTNYIKLQNGLVLTFGYIEKLMDQTVIEYPIPYNTPPYVFTSRIVGMNCLASYDQSIAITNNKDNKTGKYNAFRINANEKSDTGNGIWGCYFVIGYAE